MSWWPRALFRYIPQLAQRLSKKSIEVDEWIEADIAALNPKALNASLVSSVGNHCKVWRTNIRCVNRGEELCATEFVIKYPINQYQPAEIRLLHKQYRELKEALEDIVPNALFFVTEINKEINVCVLAQAINIWFNIANPLYEEEAVPLLKSSFRARAQLRRFLDVARQFREADRPRMIDLYGLDNLVLDSNHEIRYLDSFEIFFFEDMLEFLGGEDSSLERKMRISMERTRYLEKILRLAEEEPSPTPAPVIA